MSLERPQSRASSGSRGPPPTPPPTYLWEEVRRSRSRGGYPWTILYKPPLPDQLDIELLLKGEISTEHFGEEKLRGQSACPSDKRTHIRNRLRDRERSRRARSEPTPSLPSSSTVSLSNMDQAMAVDPSAQSDELDDFPLPDEDIPDFVMAYLQSDKGNLDEDIPDHILEYIQSRAAILEKSQQHMKQSDDEIFYTKDEMRIMEETRRRLEEQGEFIVEPSTVAEDADAFDQFFQRAAVAGHDSVMPFPQKTEQARPKESRQIEEAEPVIKKSKKGGKFKMPNITMPNKSQLNIKMPKFGPGRKKTTDEAQGDEEGGKKAKPARRPHSSSPMRQKINQQLESWNNSLKKFKQSRSGRNQDGQVKGFVALLPGRSSKPTKTKEPENQYEEVGPPRSNPAATIESAEDKARFSPSQENEAEETMEDIENLPESEVADMARNGMIVDREVADVIVTRGEFVDIDIDEDFEDEEEVMGAQTEIEQVPGGDKTVVDEPEATGFAARSRKAFEFTKTKIQTSLSKEQLQATRNKLQSTLSKQNLQATRKKVQSSLSKKNLQATRDKLQSTLSKENFQATRNKLQTSLNSTLNRKKSKTEDPQLMVPQGNIFPSFPHDSEREYETSTPVDRKTRHPTRNKTSDEEYPHEAPTAKRRNKKAPAPVEIEPVSQSNEYNNIEEETEEDLEDELEPKLEFSIHGSERPRPSSVSQSTETLPEEESDKENVVVRPKRQRYRHRRHGFHEEFGRPHSAHGESNIRSSWVEKANAYPTISQEMLAAFCAPVNSLEAVDSSFGSMRKPDRPVRSRSKKELNSTAEDHLYSNVAPRRTKRAQRKTLTDSSNDGIMKTWPRKSAAERPTVPKRCKSKHSNKPVFSVCSNYQTWPRRSMLAQSPPTAPKRTRSRGQMNCQHAVELRDLEEQIEMPTSNILTEADTLFGAESRFIDEETDTDRSLQRARSSNSCMQLELNIPGESTVGHQAKIINSNSSPRPLAPARTNKGGSLRKPKRSSHGSGETTWPRMSKAQPSAPQRRKPSLKKKSESAVHLELEKPQKKLPTVPASTPSEEVQEISYNLDGESASSTQAGLDQILEILASTFPNETSPQEENKEEQQVAAEVTEERIHQQTDFSPVNLHEEEELADENPYTEIKQFQRRAPPPRPPPPTYAPASTSASYSYIYTVPRRKKGISNSVSPERPPRTYCTIRPHRPPRKSRTRTQEIVFQSTDHTDTNVAPRRHSFSGGDDANKDERDLQSAPVVERMRARPLPAPPRAKRNRSRSPPNKPPRSRTSSLRTLNPCQEENICAPVEQVAVAATETTQTVQQEAIVDEYEPIENPVQVEEISVGIQTDPLPEYDESMLESSEIEMPSDEINNNLYGQREERVSEPVTFERPEERQEQVTAPVVLEPEAKELETPCPPATVWSAANSPDPELEITELVSVQQNQQQPPRVEDEPVKSSKKSSASRRTEEEDETDSFSQIPAHFLRSIAPLPPIQVDLPTRLHLSDLDVDRLNVREVTADRLIVSSVDTNSLQVCQMTTSNASGQLVFNIGPGVTIPYLAGPRETEHVPSDTQSSSLPPTSPVPAETPQKSDEIQQEEKEPAPPAVKPKRPPPSEKIPVEREEPVVVEPPAPSTHNVQTLTAHSTEDANIGVSRQSEEPSVSSLAMQLASLSSRHLMNGACVVATETYSMAQRVAELGLQQLNEQLQRRGIQFDDKEKDDLKAVLLMLLIVVCAIFLLGMGKQRISTHWDFYFPN